MNWRAKLAERRAVAQVPECANDELTKPTKALLSVLAVPRLDVAGGDPGLLSVLAVPRPRDSELRAHLLALAASEYIDAAHVHRLHADDVAACAGQSDATLRAYLRALERDAGMDAGIVPPEWTTAPQCAGCGPVWLWPDAARVLACPWCFRRKAGKAIPRPLVHCRDCRHFRPNAMNPEAGGGSCTVKNEGHWPGQRHRCPDWRNA